MSISNFSCKCSLLLYISSQKFGCQVQHNTFLPAFIVKRTPSVSTVPEGIPSRQLMLPSLCKNFIRVASSPSERFSLVYPSYVTLSPTPTEFPIFHHLTLYLIMQGNFKLTDNPDASLLSRIVSLCSFRAADFSLDHPGNSFHWK